MKKCSKCKQVKSLNEFHKDRTNKDGLEHSCKKCKNKRAKEYRKKYPWRIIYAGVKQRCNNPKNCNFRKYGAKNRKLLMTIKDIKFLWVRDKAWLLKQPSIDRKDNDGHYELSNCRFIERGENTARFRREKTECKRGHLYTLENTYINPTTKKRHCKECVKIKNRRYYLQKIKKLMLIIILLFFPFSIYSGINFSLKKKSSTPIIEDRLDALEKFYFKNRHPTIKDLIWYADWMVKAAEDMKREDLKADAEKLKEQIRGHTSPDKMRGAIKEFREKIRGCVIVIESVPK